ncbi:MAG TPA: aminopeptidase P family N-terminal domain-containing protein, partial [Rhodopila sp.]
MKAAVSDFVQTERLAQQMDEHGLDAIVARAGINFTYLSGLVYPGTLARHLDLADSPRGVYLVWPRSGEPRMVVNAIAEGLARRDSFIEHFDVYEGYSEPPVERLAKVIAGMGLAESKIGFETNFISAADWDVLRSRLPRMQASDSVDLMDMVRAVKTPAELGRLKRGADLLDEAYLTHFPTVRPGMRERDLHAALVAHCLAGGSEFTHGILNSQRNTVPYAGESDFPF